MSEDAALSSLESRVILTLAEEGSRTGYSFHHAKKGKKADMSPASWDKVRRSLLEKNLISYLESKSPVRGRQVRPIWLSEEGKVKALEIGANPDLLLETAEKMNQRTSYLETLCGMTKIWGSKGLQGTEFMKLMMDEMTRTAGNPKSSPRLMRSLELMRKTQDWQNIKTLMKGKGPGSRLFKQMFDDLFGD